MVNFFVRFCGFMHEGFQEIGNFVLTLAVFSYTGCLMAGAISVLIPIERPDPVWVFHFGMANLCWCPPLFAALVPAVMIGLIICTSIVRALPSKIRIY